MIKEIEVGGVKHSITLADDMVGKGLKKDENGAISVDVDNLDINKKLESLIVNNLTDGGADKALSAEMGKELIPKSAIVQETGDGENVVMSQKAVSEKLSDLEGIVNGTDVEQMVEIESFQEDKYWNMDKGETYSPGTPDALVGCRCFKIAVSVGEKYKIFGKGTSTAAGLYVLTGIDNIVIAKGGAINRRDSGELIEVTENGYLYVNLPRYDSATDKVLLVSIFVEGLVDKVTELSAEMVIEETFAMPLIADSAFNAYDLALGDKFTTYTAGSASGVASNRIVVQEGEVYRLKGRGDKYAYKGYFVVNTDNVVTQIIGDNEEYDLDLIIAEGAKYLFVNCVNYNADFDGVWKIKAESLKDVVLQMQSEGSAETIVDTIDMSSKIVVGYAYNLGGNSVGQKYTSTPSTSATSAYARIAVNPNSKYEIRGEGSKYAYRFYAFLDANLTILELSTSSYNTRNEALILTPPSDAAMLIVNYTNYDASLDSLIRKDTYDIEESIKAIYHLLKGKNIVCFGDSITQFSKNGMRYSDYLKEIGASIVNVGIGGTQIRQRATPSTSPTSVEQAYGGLDMASLASAVANNDYAIAEASAAYVQNNSAPQYNPQEVIERLKAIDWSKVNIVTILGGTNDWNNGGNLGEATDESASSTLGALNYIIKSLLTAHPHIKVYCFTPLVRYVASSLAERNDGTWAGNMENSEGKTLLDYVDAIKYVAESNCIPVCDMYRTMGWNKYNFSQYFNDSDGVHPYNGFKEIADRMQSFILANL